MNISIKENNQWRHHGGHIEFELSLEKPIVDLENALVRTGNGMKTNRSIEISKISVQKHIYLFQFIFIIVYFVNVAKYYRVLYIESHWGTPDCTYNKF